MKQILLITVYGEDRPGVTSTVTEILGHYAVNILDIGQAVIHDNLTLGLLAEIPQDAESAAVLKDLLFSIHDLGMQVRFQPISADSYESWVTQQGKPRHIITLLARKVSARQIAEVTAVAARYGLNIDNISRLSGRVPLDEVAAEHSRACVEFSARGTPTDIDALRGELMEIANRSDVDVAYQEDNIYRRNRRLVVFDMDSTLIETEVIDELARRAGVGDEVAAITERAMRGELDFQQSFRERLQLLKGLDAQVLEEIGNALPLTEGAETLTRTLKRLGYKTAIISGGFTYFGRQLQQRLGIDYMFANELAVADGKITGEVQGTIVDGQRKAQLLRELAEKEGLSLEQVIAVGDGANDLPMLNIAGLGIAFRAKPLVKASAKQSISTLGLDGILYLIGFRDRDQVS